MTNDFLPPFLKQAVDGVIREAPEYYRKTRKNSKDPNVSVINRSDLCQLICLELASAGIKQFPDVPVLSQFINAFIKQAGIKPSDALTRSPSAHKTLKTQVVPDFIVYYFSHLSDFDAHSEQAKKLSKASRRKRKGNVRDTVFFQDNEGEAAYVKTFTSGGKEILASPADLDLLSSYSWNVNGSSVSCSKGGSRITLARLMCLRYGLPTLSYANGCNSDFRHENLGICS